MIKRGENNNDLNEKRGENNKFYNNKINKNSLTPLKIKNSQNNSQMNLSNAISNSEVNFTLLDPKTLLAARNGHKKITEIPSNSLKKIEKVQIRCCWRKCEALDLISSRCPAIKRVMLSCRSDDEASECVLRMLKKCLLIEAISVINAKELSAVKKSLPNLKELGVTFEEDCEIGEIASKCPNLKAIELEWTRVQGSPPKLMPIFKKCTNLQALSLWGFKVCVDEIGSAEKLEQLFFYSADVCDGYLKQLSSALTKRPIRRLKLSGKNCSIKGVLFIALKLKLLEELNLTYSSVELEDLLDLLQAKNSQGEFMVFQKLERLSLQWDSLEIAKKELEKIRPGLKVDCNSWCCLMSD